MSLDTFKKNLELDAERRTRDRNIRKEKSEIFNKRGNRAFREGDLGKALTYYNQSIEQIKDNSLVYTARAMAYMNMNRFENAEEDCKLALKHNPNSIRAGLYMIKCYIYLNDRSYESLIRELKYKNPEQSALIDEYVREVKGSLHAQLKLEHVEEHINSMPKREKKKPKVKEVSRVTKREMKRE